MIARRSTCPNCGQEMYRTDTRTDPAAAAWPPLKWNSPTMPSFWPLTWCSTPTKMAIAPTSTPTAGCWSRCPGRAPGQRRGDCGARRGARSIASCASVATASRSRYSSTTPKAGDGSGAPGSGRRPAPTCALFRSPWANGGQPGTSKRRPGRARTWPGRWASNSLAVGGRWTQNGRWVGEI